MHSHWQAARLHFVLGCQMGLIGGESYYACPRKGVYWSRRAGCPQQLSCQAEYHKLRSPRADGKNLADEDVTPHRPRRLSYIIHHLSLPRLSSEPKSEWEVYNQVYGVKLTAFLNWEKITNAKHPWQLREAWNLSRSGLIVLGRGTECYGYWSLRDERCAKRDSVRESGCMWERKRQEKGIGLQAIVQTLLTQSLCYRQGRAHSQKDAGSIVWAKLPIPLLSHFPPASFVAF